MILPPRTRGVHAHFIDEQFGEVRLTDKQRDFIISVASGTENAQGGSTSDLLFRRIREATGWKDMRRMQMFCRFAYKWGLLRL